ncbi:MAG: sarcosine oxidase subunit delta [Proteobacteria bacterium]|nr:sarcosine oxidase subunit delta [Pseudomonadota bacterium]
MMNIPCPYCGDRPHVEFAYGGDATVGRPGNPAAVTTEAWLDHIYYRENPRGLHSEWWQHVAGCRRWIKVRRDTLNHQIVASGTALDDLGPDQPR